MPEGNSRPPEREQTQDQNLRPLQHAVQSQQRGSDKGAAQESGTKKGRPVSAPYDPRPETLGKRGASTSKHGAHGAKGPADSSDTT